MKFQTGLLILAVALLIFTFSYRATDKLGLEVKKEGKTVDDRIHFIVKNSKHVYEYQEIMKSLYNKKGDNQEPNDVTTYYVNHVYVNGGPTVKGIGDTLLVNAKTKQVTLVSLGGDLDSTYINLSKKDSKTLISYLHLTE